MRICYFGGYDPAYSRNRILIKGLRQAGAEVIECVDRGAKALRLPRLAARYLARARDADAIVVGACGHAYVPLARALATATRKPLVFDAFVSQHDTAIDRGTAPTSRRARRLARIDRRTAAMSDAVLLDTEQHARWYASHTGQPSAKFHGLYVGTDTDLFAPRPPRTEDGTFHVVFVGNYIPLQGVPTILRAADHLREYKDIRFTLLGRGQTYAGARALAATLGGAVAFAEPVPYETLPDVYASGDVVLGIFDDGEKAGRVIANKVFEGLAMGKPVITANTPGARSLLTDGTDVRLVRPADPHALADAILELRGDPKLRERLGLEARRTVLAHSTPAVLGARLLEICRALKEGNA